MHAHFTILDSLTTDTAYQECCALVESLLEKKENISVQLINQAEAEVLDELMWTFKPESFIPHKLIGCGEPTRSLVTLGWLEKPAPRASIFINVSQHPPAQRITARAVYEFILANEPDLANARQRYRSYQQLGFTVDTTDLRKVSSK